MSLGIYISVSPELNRAYVSNFFGGLSVIDTASGGVVTEIMGLASPIGTAVDPQLTKLYVINSLINSVSAIDTNTNQITNSIAFSCTQQDVKIDTLLHKAFITDTSCSELAVLDAATDALTAKIPLPGRPQFLTIDSQAHRAYVTYNNGILGEAGRIGGLAIVDTSTNQVITSLVLGKDPTRLALSAEGRLYVVDRFRNSVFVIDTATAAIVTEIPVGITPSDVAVVAPPAAKLTVSPATVAFGVQLAGTTSPAQTIQVRNDGNASLAIQTVLIEAGPFQIVRDTCASATLLPGSICYVTLTFTPPAAGPFAATLVIASNDSGGPKSVTVSGEGEVREDANIRSITPVIGRAGTPILIVGGNFHRYQGHGHVLIGGIPAEIRFWHADRIEALAPGGLSGVVSVQVRTRQGTSNAVDFTYAAADASVWQRFDGPWGTRCDVAFGPLATPPAKPDVIYVGSSAGCGVYASTDGGLTWDRKSRGIPKNYIWPHFPPISRIAIAPSDPETLYLGTFDAFAEAGRIFKSVNGASKWRDASGRFSGRLGTLPIRFPVFDIAIQPSDANGVYAAIEGGVYHTSDGGRHWKQVVAGNGPGAGTNVDNYTTVRIALSNPATAYTAGYTSFSTRALHHHLMGGVCTEISSIVPLPSLKTVDGGATWSAITNPAPVTFGNQTLDALVSDFAISPTSENVLLASTLSYKTPMTHVITKNDGVVRSADGGGTWKTLNGTNGSGIADSPLVRLVASPGDPNIVVALTGTPDTAFITRNGGTTWERLTTSGWEQPTSVFDLVFAGTKLCATTSHGIYVLPSY
jgi:YVTN family beta-propeller protein